MITEYALKYKVKLEKPYNYGEQTYTWFGFNETNANNSLSKPIIVSKVISIIIGPKKYAAVNCQPGATNFRENTHFAILLHICKFETRETISTIL